MLKEYDAWLTKFRTRPRQDNASPQSADPSGGENISEGDNGWESQPHLPPVFAYKRWQCFGVSVIVGKGDKLAQALTTQLKFEFNPPIEVHVHRYNKGRLIIPNSQILT